MAQILKPFHYYALAIFLALLSSLTFSDAQPAGDYRSFCQKTNYTNVCIQTIDAYTNNANLKVNATGWTQILNYRAVTFAITTQTKIGDAIRANPKTGDLNILLNQCNNLFNLTVPRLQGLHLTLLTHTNYVQYNRQLGDAMTDVEACMDGFSAKPGIQNPVGILTQNTLDAIKLVLEGVNIYQCNKRTACDR